MEMRLSQDSKDEWSDKMKPQTILVGLVTGGVVGLLLFFLAGLFLALAIAVPLGFLIAIVTGQGEIEVRRGDS